MLVGFFLAALGGCLDYQVSVIPHFIATLQLYYCTFFFAILLLTDREGSLRPRLLVTSLGLLVTFLLTRLMHGLADHTRNRIVLKIIFESGAPYYWALALWFASPLFLPGAQARYSSLFRLAIGALCLYGALCFASSVASGTPGGEESSFHFFYLERALCFAVIFPWIRAAAHDPWIRTRTARLLIGFMALMMLLGALVGLADLIGGPAVQAKLEALKLVKVEGLKVDRALPRRRLLFPMLTFNRTSYYALIALMALFISFLSCTLKPKHKRLILIALAATAFVLIQSYTRGLMLSALAALAVWSCLVSRRVLIVIAAGLVLLLVILPQNRRSYLLSVFRPSTYQSSQRMTSIKARMIAWNYGLERLEENPLTGIGYGTNTIEHAFKDYVRIIQNPYLLNDIKNNNSMQHMHNLWLETALESGIPAMLALLTFCLARWGLLAGNYRRATGMRRRRLAAWIAFEFALMMAGMAFYMLKQNFGMLTWFVWAYVLSEQEWDAVSTPPETCAAKR